MDSSLAASQTIYTQHLGALTSALVEFQKAQCFFSTTLQIAALIVLPDYLSQVRGKDQILLRLASGNAVAPIMLTLTHIGFLGGRNSWYLLTLSGVSFTLGTATYWASSPQFSGSAIDAYYFYENPVVPVMSCGNLAPFAPCFNRNNFFKSGKWDQITGVTYNNKLPETFGLAVWIISFLILFYRIVSKVCKTSNNDARLLIHLRSLRQSLAGETPVLSSTKPALLRLKTLRQKAYILGLKQRSWDYLQLAAGSVAVLLQLISVIQVLEFSSDIMPTQMSFGQIVAVAIWVPVLLEYVYLDFSEFLVVVSTKYH